MRSDSYQEDGKALGTLLCVPHSAIVGRTDRTVHGILKLHGGGKAPEPSPIQRAAIVITSLGASHDQASSFLQQIDHLFGPLKD